jgi:hypothetical protein
VCALMIIIEKSFLRLCCNTYAESERECLLRSRRSRSVNNFMLEIRASNAKNRTKEVMTLIPSPPARTKWMLNYITPHVFALYHAERVIEIKLANYAISKMSF